MSANQTKNSTVLLIVTLIDFLFFLWNNKL